MSSTRSYITKNMNNEEANLTCNQNHVPRSVAPAGLSPQCFYRGIRGVAMHQPSVNPSQFYPAMGGAPMNQQRVVPSQSYPSMPGAGMYQPWVVPSQSYPWMPGVGMYQCGVVPSQFYPSMSGATMHQPSENHSQFYPPMSGKANRQSRRRPSQSYPSMPGKAIRQPSEKPSQLYPLVAGAPASTPVPRIVATAAMPGQHIDTLGPSATFPSNTTAAPPRTAQIALDAVAPAPLVTAPVAPDAVSSAPPATDPPATAQVAPDAVSSASPAMAQSEQRREAPARPSRRHRWVGSSSKKRKSNKQDEKIGDDGSEDDLGCKAAARFRKDRRISRTSHHHQNHHKPPTDGEWVELSAGETRRFVESQLRFVSSQLRKRDNSTTARNNGPSKSKKQNSRRLSCATKQLGLVDQDFARSARHLYETSRRTERLIKQDTSQFTENIQTNDEEGKFVADSSDPSRVSEKLCIGHCPEEQRKYCEVEGCSLLACTYGTCKRHGPDCAVPCCTNIVTSRHVCIKHNYRDKSYKLNEKHVIDAWSTASVIWRQNFFKKHPEKRKKYEKNLISQE